MGCKRLRLTLMEFSPGRENYEESRIEDANYEHTECAVQGSMASPVQRSMFNVPTSGH